jgi:phosphoribosylamine---glycine ligase
MRVLLVGSGGREHALAWALAQSDGIKALYCAPGNAGIESCAECVNIAADDVDGLVVFALQNKIDFVVVGPEAPLVKGLADRLQEKKIPVFGPTAAAACLEGSKAFTKDLCKKYNIPTAAYGRFKNVDEAKAFIGEQNPPVVVKADGLAAGKGVVIAETREDAVRAAQDMLSGSTFGDAGAEIVIEEFLPGEELSYFALADGKTILPFSSAQDHKRVGDGDKGPNTGGMGAYSPAHLLTPMLEQKILTRIIEPTIKAMQSEGCPFTGVLYAGIMVVKDEPYLIEYNARFGDPECQVLIPRLQGNLLEILFAAAQGRLADVKDSVKWSPDPAMCVVIAAKGYPGAYVKNTIIRNLQDTVAVEDLIVFHAGTARNEEGEIVSTGGRVLGITATGVDLREARGKVYRAIKMIDWPEGFCRNDIGWRALKAQDDTA